MSQGRAACLHADAFCACAGATIHIFRAMLALVMAAGTLLATAWGDAPDAQLADGAPLPADQVISLPGYGAPKTKHYAGFSEATPDGRNKLFYYFVEADVGSSSAATPFLIWLNGGPGASSLMGLMVENLGPQQMAANSSLVDNVHRITKKYHLMAVDNPVGAGFSYTEAEAYVRSEEEMRQQFVHALRAFYDKHPEYKRNPLWVTGESYAGKYVPNIAFELATAAQEINFQGIVVGNGLYNETAQYQTIGEMAYGAGVIDETLLNEERRREASCLAAIGEQWEKAGDFCENVTVRWLYTGPAAAAGELFYYDFGAADAAMLDDLTVSMGKYLNRADVKLALHAGGSTWMNADETGPVARALAADFTRPSAPVVAALLEMGKNVVLYNGVRDGSVCNHLGNLRALLAMSWSGAAEFAASMNSPWPSKENVLGHIRGARGLRYATVMRTGHLVPAVVPESFATLLDIVLERLPAGVADDFLV